MTVRFGNVLGSSGSVVPLFQKQLAAGQPLTVTHPAIERFFMTIPEAVGLTLHASAYGAEHEDERGQIFVLDMGQPIRIVDVARRLIRLAGLEPDRDVSITFTGLRPGEKLYEELFDSAERRLSSALAGVHLAASKPIELGRLVRSLEQIAAICARHDGDALRSAMAGLIPGYPSQGSADASLAA
jgi:O-antigen biosynthesis protein WbqV